jgi:Derlin-2/3
MHAYVLYENCRRYEQNPFNTGGGGTSADFLWMVILGMGVLCVVAHFFGLVFMAEPLLYMIMYVWSRREPDMMLNMYGFKFKALYCPWVYVAIRVVMGGSPTEPLIGVAVGHVYYFLIGIHIFILFIQ